MGTVIDLPEWITKRIVIDDATGCWIWQVGIDVRGYGRVKGFKSRLAHRATYETLVGPIPAGLELDHLCRRPPCVNPAHLEPVTHAENMRRSPLQGAVMLARTHCPHGHPYDADNTLRDQRGHRRCRTCNKTRLQNRKVA